MVERSLLSERTRRRERLARLQTRLSFREWGFGRTSGWVRHAWGAGPPASCVAAYVRAVCMLYPQLGWSEADADQRRRALTALHDAYADVDLDRIECIRAWATDRPPDVVASGVLREHLDFLGDRIRQVERSLAAS